MRATHLFCSLALVGLLTGCGASLTEGGGTTAGSIDVPEEITDETFGQYERTYWGLQLSDPSRAELRDALVGYLARRTPAVLESDDYGEVIGQFHRIAELYSPEDFGEGRLPEELEPLARYLREKGSPRGDEARVLSGLLVLRTLEDDASYDREYGEVVQWGRDARSTLDSPVERYGRLIDVWREHARLTPSPEVLDLLARMHVEQRDAIIAMMQGEGPSLAASPRILAESRQGLVLVRRAPLDVAGVFLEHGDIASALTHVQAMGDASGIENQLIRILQDARDGDQDAVMELAGAYAEGRPDVQQGLCRYGRRKFPDDPLFPLCLAQVAAEAGEYPRATGWYAEAIRLAPEERDIYDEALQRLAEAIAQGFDADPAETRDMAQAAVHILEERMRRWSDDEPAVTRQQLYYVLGLLEMNAGNIEEARRRLEASLDLEESAEVHLQLGRIAEATGQPEDAARHYRKALDMISPEGDGALQRAQVLESLGDAFRAGGDAAQAERMYRQALDLWSDASDGAEGEVLARIQLRRGILLDRLGRHDEAVAAFGQAMDAAPDHREVYSQILSHLVSSEPPSPELAAEVFQRAQNQLSLEPEWQVYFALWVAAVDGRAGVALDDEARGVLETHAQTQAWWSRLAKYGLGQLPYEELLQEAGDVGERTEAMFYEGARLLSAGDREGALRQFRLVLDTHMVNFFEFMMALELLRGDDAQAATADGETSDATETATGAAASTEASETAADARAH